MKKYSVNSNDLQDFCEKCDTLCSSKLILADKKISNLLKTIAASEEMCVFLKDCLEGFNYKIDFMKCKQPVSGKKDKFILVLPQEKKLIAFVFCLLCEFENKEKDLTDFLIEFYDFNELYTDGFSNFCNKVIVPFKEAFLSLTDSSEEFAPAQISPAETENNYVKIENYPKIYKLYQELNRNINKETLLTVQEREEYTAVADAFIDACKKGEERFFTVLFTALKHMCKNFKFLNNKIRQLEKLL